ncbi:DUF2690 domain-containing protein [Actinomadura gamaensis]|uniref:DUF2690 domain-containing protein n=1 Tax=Actinomadura gamaensis TaxID=1763541 RepID=A0ABV9U9W4_9ACTN
MRAWQPLPQSLPPEVRHLTVRLRETKDVSGLSLDVLARRTPASRSAWGRYLNGQALPPREVVAAFAALARADHHALLALWDLADHAHRHRALSSSAARADRNSTPADPGRTAQAFTEDTPTGRKPGKDTPGGNATSEDAFIKDAPDEEAFIEDAPDEDASSGDAPNGDARGGGASYGDASGGDASGSGAFRGGTGRGGYQGAEEVPRAAWRRVRTVLVVGAGAVAVGMGMGLWWGTSPSRSDASAPSARGPAHVGSPSPSRRPPAVSAAAADCRDAGCDQQSAAARGCERDAVTATTVRVDHALMRLRFSPSCRALWGELEQGRRYDRIEVDAGGHSAKAKVRSSAGTATTPMLAASTPASGTVCASLATGARECGSARP